MALDYGIRRVGVAVTDPLQIIASPLDTIETSQILTWLESYFAKETVDKLIIGKPVNLDMSDTHSTSATIAFTEKLRAKWPDLKVIEVDERLTSKIAFQTMIDGGLGKKKRRDKKMIDKISASLILQTYLGI